MQELSEDELTALQNHFDFAYENDFIHSEEEEDIFVSLESKLLKQEN